MPEKNNHPSMEEIMAFVTPQAELDECQRKRAFGLIAHFVNCEECRMHKDAMLQFTKKLYASIGNAASDILTRKIQYSLEQLDIDRGKLNGRIKLAFHGKIAGNEMDSRIFLEGQTSTSVPDDSYESEQEHVSKGRNRISDAENNEIYLGAQKISVLLQDDGMENHSVLIIPERISEKPTLIPMEKHPTGWKMEYSCPEDEYDVVVF